MADHRTTQITVLRRTIDCLPVRTRNAMLVGISNNTIVVGAYATDDGVCPMLAAHRAGGRTDFIAFARAWDEYCFRGVRRRKRRPRLATASELGALRAYIESSLLAEEKVDLAGAMAEHHDLLAKRDFAAEREREFAAERERALAAERQRVRDVTAEPVRAAKPARGTTPERARPGDPDRSRELSRRPGWGWMRIMRSYDEYEQAMASFDQTEAERELTHSQS